jgi:hypothetical protein
MSPVSNAGRQSRVAHLTVAATVAAVINLMAPNAAAIEINDDYWTVRRSGRLVYKVKSRMRR